jgi:hypothetical protein
MSSTRTKLFCIKDMFKIRKLQMRLQKSVDAPFKTIYVYLNKFGLRMGRKGRR